MTKPQKWALDGTSTWIPGEEPTEAEIEEALAFQQAAAPLLAVVEAAVDDDGCLICDALLGSWDHKPDCPVPRALEAMRTEP